MIGTALMLLVAAMVAAVVLPFALGLENARSTGYARAFAGSVALCFAVISTVMTVLGIVIMSALLGR